MKAGLVLVAEDSEDDFFLMQRDFRRAGFMHPLFRVLDGLQATAYLSGEGHYSDRDAHPLPALLLLDLRMPHQDGFALLQWIRQQAHFAHLPVIVLITSGHLEDTRRAYELGATSFATKPVTADQIVAICRKLQILCDDERIPAAGLVAQSGAWS